METTNTGVKTHYRILYFVSTSHFLIDLMTSIVPAMLLVLQKDLSLSYVQLGTVVMVANLTSSMLQPFLGYITDRRPTPWLLVANWYKQRANRPKKTAVSRTGVNQYGALALLVAVVSLRSWIHSGISSFLPLFYENVRGISISLAEYYLFVFLLAGAIGTLLGGPLADRFGKKNMLMFSMVGAIPFILLIPHLIGVLAFINIFIVGFISLSSFAVTVVYAQELLPGKVGMVSGLMIGFAIGAGGVGASVMGKLADWIGIASLIQLLVLIPVIAWLMGIWLPRDRHHNVAVSHGA